MEPQVLAPLPGHIDSVEAVALQPWKQRAALGAGCAKKCGIYHGILPYQPWPFQEGKSWSSINIWIIWDLPDTWTHPSCHVAELESFGEHSGGSAIPARERFSSLPAVWMEPPSAWTHTDIQNSCFCTSYPRPYGKYTKPHGCDLSYLSRSRFGMRNRWISDVQSRSMKCSALLHCKDTLW